MSRLPALPWELASTRWADIIEPVLGVQPNVSPSFLINVELTTGINVVNHRLQRKPQGWVVVDKQAPGDVYRTAPYNTLTLTLTSSANMTVSLWIY